MSKPKSQSAKKRNSGKGVLKRKVLEAQITQECLGQLDDIVQVIHEVLGEMNDDARSKNVKRLKIAADAVKIAKNQVEDATKALAPIAGLSYASKRRQLEEERRDAVKFGLVGSETDSAARRTQIFVRKNRDDLNRQPRKSFRTCVTEKKPQTLTFSSKSTTAKSKSGVVSVPSPANGKVYTPREVLDIVTPLDKMMRGFLHSEFVRRRFVVPKSTKALRELVRIYKDKPHCCPEWWGQSGRKPLASMTNFSEDILSEVGKSTGEVITVDAVKDALIAEKENRLRANGIEPVNVTVSWKTAQNYHSGLALHENGVPIASTSTRPKTHSRWTSERSLISAMTFALTVAATHFRPVEKETKGNFPDKVTEGAKLLRDLVQEANNGAPLYLVPPHRIMNHDDNTRYFFEGTCNDKNMVAITHLNSYDKRNRTSLHEKPKAGQSVKGNLNGCRLKGSFIETADGTCGPAMFSIMNLSTKELPHETCPEGFIVLKIEGLAPGASTNPYDTSVGYLCVMRSDGTDEPDTKRYAFLRDVVLTDFLRQTRDVYDNRPTGSALTEEDAAIVWMDGDLPQLKTVTDPVRLQRTRENRMYSNKHSAARSAAEQACDLNNVFPQLAHQGKVVTVESKDTPLKRRILEAFKVAEEEYGLKLKSSKKSTMVDTAACLPIILGKIIKQDTIREGFLLNGMIDRISKCAPDLKVMIRETLQRDMTTEEWELCLEHFVDLYRIMVEKGYVQDDEFIRRGFPADIDPDGEEVIRNQGIQQEHMHRSKIIDHPWQIALRNELTEKRVEAGTRKHLKLVEITRQWLADNRDCEKVIFKAMDLPETSGRRMLANAELKHMCVPVSKLLKAFIFVRSNKRGDATANLSSKVKGKVVDAVPGASTLLRMAFDLRSKGVELREVTEALPLTAASAGAQVPRLDYVEITRRVRADASVVDNPFTVTETFIKDVKAALDPCDAHPLNSNAALNIRNIQESTNLLHGILQARLVRHIEQRIVDKSKHDHYCLRWVEQVNPGKISFHFVDFVI